MPFVSDLKNREQRIVIEQTDPEARSQLAETKADLEKTSSRLDEALAKIKLLDPLKRNISSATIAVQFSIDSPQLTPGNHRDFGAHCGAVLVGKNGESLLMIRTASYLIDEQSRFQFAGTCDFESTALSKPLQELRDASRILVVFPATVIPSSSRVNIGRVTIVLNGSLPLEFEVSNAPIGKYRVEEKTTGTHTAFVILDLEDGFSVLGESP